MQNYCFKCAKIRGCSINNNFEFLSTQTVGQLFSQISILGVPKFAQISALETLSPNLDLYVNSTKIK